MAWWKKAEPPAQRALQPDPKLTPEQAVAEALRAYQDDFYGRIRGSVSADVRKAKEILERARHVVGQSGLGPALAPTLLEHVQHWPSWSTHSNFYEFVHFPCRYVSGRFDQINEGRTKTITVSFSYKDALYTVLFAEEAAVYRAPDDMNAYATVCLYRDAEEVFGLDIHYDMSKGDAARWRWSDVLAFQPGPWMTDLIEMAGYIEGNFWRGVQQRQDADAIARAQKIQLPD